LAGGGGCSRDAGEAGAESALALQDSVPKDGSVERSDAFQLEPSLAAQAIQPELHRVTEYSAIDRLQQLVSLDVSIGVVREELSLE
jgi:hypothetical protein